MENIFIHLLNLSISAGWLVLAIIAVRFLFKKSPKWIICLLWAMVALRLVCPISIESALSLIPSAETVPEEIIYAKNPQIHTGIDSLNSTVNPIISDTLAPEPLTSANPAQILCAVAWNVWLLGMIAMIIYAIISYFRIRHKVKASLKRERGVYVTDNIDTPFILGVIRPKIYLPSTMSEENEKYVLAHERAHLSRLDHLWKPLGYLLLCIYWFNPLMWLAYVLLCRDIELACDEKVILQMEAYDKKEYSNALLSCSVKRKMIAACPLAFGEVGVKARIKSVLSYKKPAFWIIIICLTLSIVMAVCFLTDPPAEADIPDTIEIVEAGSELSGVSIEIKKMDFETSQPYITVVWKNNTDKGVGFGTPFDILRYEDNEWKNCRVTEAFWTAILNLMHPMSEREETYHLWHIDMTKEGLYRLELECTIDGNDTEYKLWVDFKLSEGIPLTTVKQYKAKERVFYSGTSSFVISPENAPMWKVSAISNSELFLWEMRASDVDWFGLSAMTETELTDENFDKRLDVAPFWTDGYSLEKLKKENKRAWEIPRSGNDSQNGLYMLLEQKNGDMYLCMGHRGDSIENDKYQWILKLEKMDVGSEENTDIRPCLIYNGKYYVDLTTGESKLPDGMNLSYKGRISPEMANNTGLVGMRYFTNEEEEYYIYVEHIVDGNTLYKMWEAGRGYVKPVSTMTYVCSETKDPIKPFVTLYPDTNEFMFNLAGFSSYLPMGKYTLTEDTLTFDVDGDENVYVFKVNGNNLYFDAENSTELPKYKYSANSQPEYPFGDGAKFGRVYGLQDSYNGLTTVGKGDIDGDGKTETLTIGPGPTSGLFTFTLTAEENGKAEYFNIFQSDFMHSAFVNSEGELYLRCESVGEESAVHMYKISVEDVNIVLSENGEEMAYWGEQGLDSSWFTRYEE